MTRPKPLTLVLFGLALMCLITILFLSAAREQEKEWQDIVARCDAFEYSRSVGGRR